MREDGARPELEPGLPLVEQEAPGHVGREEIGRALQPLEGQVQRLREQPRDQRLREARVVLDQDVAVREDPGEDAFQHVDLPDDHAREGSYDLSAPLGDAADGHRRRSSEAMRTRSASSEGPRPNRRPGGLSSPAAGRDPSRARAQSRGQSTCSK